MTIQLSVKDPFFLPHLGCHIELSVKIGTIQVLSGENGIGKTTFLRKLAEQMAGKAIHAEQRAPDFFFDRKLRKFREIIHTSAELDKPLFDEFWSSSGLSHKEERNLSALSGGEAQMLKLITSCAANGELYLLDEPGQYLDPEKKKLANDLIQRLRARGKTLIIVEHDGSWITGIDQNSVLVAEGGVLRARGR